MCCLQETHFRPRDTYRVKMRDWDKVWRCISMQVEIIHTRAKINETEAKKTMEKINEMKSWFFEKINTIDKHLARCKKKVERAQINKIRKEKGEVTRDTT